MIRASGRAVGVILGCEVSDWGRVDARGAGERAAEAGRPMHPVLGEHEVHMGGFLTR